MPEWLDLSEAARDASIGQARVMLEQSYAVRRLGAMYVPETLRSPRRRLMADVW